MIIFFKKYKYVIILLLVSLITHLRWLDFSSVLNFGDWYYWPNEPTKQLWNSWGAWVNYWDFGSVNIQLSFNFFKLIWSSFTNIGFSYDSAVKITFLIPIAVLGFITPYILSKKLTSDESIAFVIALFYGATSYFLVRQTGHLPIAFVYALAPLVLYFFIKALEINKLVNWLIFNLVYWISCCYEIRITYIVTFILFFYFIFFYISDIKKYWKNVTVSTFLLIGLNAFWLIPTIFGGFSRDISAVANRGIFGNFLFDPTHAFALSNDPWTGGLPNMSFIKQPIVWYFWFIPIIAFSSYFFKRNSKYKKEIIFFGIMSLIGIFLTKQATEPLVGVYSWLYNNFPGFNLFRDASKFYIITAIGYAGLLGYALLSLKEYKNKIFNRYIFGAFSVIIIFIAVWNTKPLITGEFGTMFVPRHIPKDYLVLNDFILKQSEYFRTIWIPNYSRWGIYVNEKPKISDINVIQSGWKDFINYKSHDNDWSVQEQVMDIFSKNFSNKLFDISSLKYIIIPLQDKENDDDFFVDYGGKTNSNIRNWYINELNNIKWLKKINIGTKDLAVYENENYKEHLYVTSEQETIYKNLHFSDIDWSFINPTEYKISLKNLKENVYLNFSEKYYSGWSLRVGKFNWFSVLTNENYFIDNKYHFENDAKLNSFLIDPNNICKDFDCKKNVDGSYDIDLTLYFKPQSYFYLGIIISGITLLGCFSYLGYDFVKRRKKKYEVVK